MPKPPKIVHFAGHDIYAEHVVAIDPIQSHSTGTMECQWSYGFTVRLVGNNVTLLTEPLTSYGYSGGQSREDYRKRANAERSRFLDLLWGK